MTLPSRTLDALLRTWCSYTIMALVWCALSCAVLAAEAPVPSVEEVDLLAKINRHRSNRVTGDFSTYGDIHAAFPQLNIHYFNLTSTEPKQPPLVFSPALMTAARIMLTNGLTPVTFEPLDHAPVFAAVSYQPATTGLIVCGFDQPNPQMAYLTSFAQIIDKLLHPSGFIQPIHGGPKLLEAAWREAGIAQQTKKGRTSLVIVLGAGSATRYLGGQVFADGNRNGFCDLDEGLVGASVTVGASTITTGPGGIWGLALAHVEPGEVLFTNKRLQAKRSFDGGTVNQTIDFRLPNPTDIATAQRLASSVEKAAKGPKANLRKNQVALLSMTRSADLDDELRARVDDLTAPVQTSFDATINEVRSALALDPQEFKNEMRALQKKWDGAIPTWFSEWGNIYQFRRSIREVFAKPVGEQAQLAQPLLKPLAKAQGLAYDPDMRAFYTEFRESLQKLEPQTPTKKGK